MLLMNTGKNHVMLDIQKNSSKGWPLFRIKIYIYILSKWNSVEIQPKLTYANDKAKSTNPRALTPRSFPISDMVIIPAIAKICWKYLIYTYKIIKLSVFKYLIKF